MNSLYILGNGFDIAHHIAARDIDSSAFKTSFSDFKTYCKKNFPLVYSVLNYCLDEKWSSFEDRLGQITIDVLLEFSRNIRFDSFLDSFHEQLEIAFESWINQIKLTNGKCWKIKEDSLFFSFNYTLTLETCYSIDDCRILHIHGKCGDSKEVHLKPCVGHALTDEEITNRVSTASICHKSDFKSFLEWMRKDTASNINDCQNQLFFDLIKQVNEVYVLGFSFGKVDWPYIDHIFRQLKQDSVITIAFHDPDKDFKQINCYLTHNHPIQEVVIVNDSNFLLDNVLES